MTEALYKSTIIAALGAVPGVAVGFAGYLLLRARQLPHG
jgi:hypothetical protein